MIRINVLGDPVLTDPINELARQAGSSAILCISMKRFLSAADLNVFNLETPLTSREKSEKKVEPAFRETRIVSAPVQRIN